MFKFKDRLPHLLMSSVVHADSVKMSQKNSKILEPSLNSGHAIIENDF